MMLFPKAISFSWRQRASSERNTNSDFVAIGHREAQNTEAMTPCRSMREKRSLHCLHLISRGEASR